MAHTPGPWTIDDTWSQTCGAGWSISEQKGGEHTEEHASNGRLISAAPELLAVLEEIVQADDAAHIEMRNMGIEPPPHTMALTEKARAAIAKARGTK